jgi:hypothetical protein
MGLDDRDKLMPQMLKRRSPYGQLISGGNLIPQLESKILLSEGRTEGA